MTGPNAGAQRLEDNRSDHAWTAPCFLSHKRLVMLFRCISQARATSGSHAPSRQHPSTLLEGSAQPCPAGKGLVPTLPCLWPTARVCRPLRGTWREARVQPLRIWARHSEFRVVSLGLAGRNRSQKWRESYTFIHVILSKINPTTDPATERPNRGKLFCLFFPIQFQQLETFQWEGCDLAAFVNEQERSNGLLKVSFTPTDTK